MRLIWWYRETSADDTVDGHCPDCSKDTTFKIETALAYDSRQHLGKRLFL